MPKPSRSPKPARSARRHALHHARALRPVSERGPTCATCIADAGIARVVAAIEDPDRRTAGAGLRGLREAGIEVEVGGAGPKRRRSLAAISPASARPPAHHLKLALSIDGKIALPSGESKWITGEDARAHVHLERAHSDMILVGRGTYLADSPSLDVRLPGLEDWSRGAPCSAAASGRGLGNTLVHRRKSPDFMTSTTCSSKAARRRLPPSSPPTWSTAS